VSAVRDEFKTLFKSLSSSNAKIWIDYADKISNGQKNFGDKVVEEINKKLEKLDKLDKLDSLHFTSHLDERIELTKSNSGSFSSLPQSKTLFKTTSIITYDDLLVDIEKFEPIDSISLKKSFPQLSQRKIEQLIRKLLKKNKIYLYSVGGQREYKINRGGE
jgi:hypothetical protein